MMLGDILIGFLMISALILIAQIAMNLSLNRKMDKLADSWDRNKREND